MLLRIFFSAALLAVGYYVGKQVGRSEHIRHSLHDNDDPLHDVTDKSIRP